MYVHTYSVHRRRSPGPLKRDRTLHNLCMPMERRRTSSAEDICKIGRLLALLSLSFLFPHHRRGVSKELLRSYPDTHTKIVCKLLYIVCITGIKRGGEGTLHFAGATIQHRGTRPPSQGTRGGTGMWGRYQSNPAILKCCLPQRRSDTKSRAPVG